MADERADQHLNTAPAAKEGHLQSKGRRENGAQPLMTEHDDRVRDADRRAGPAVNEGRLGPEADPAEGKR